jgi:hypothetical protein
LKYRRRRRRHRRRGRTGLGELPQGAPSVASLKETETPCREKKRRIKNQPPPGKGAKVTHFFFFTSVSHRGDASRPFQGTSKPSQASEQI